MTGDRPDDRTRSGRPTSSRRRARDIARDTDGGTDGDTDRDRRPDARSDADDTAGRTSIDEDPIDGDSIDADSIDRDATDEDAVDEDAVDEGSVGDEPTHVAASTRRPEPDPPSAAHGPAAIVTDGLSKQYGEATALAPLDLRVEYGDRISLIGHNGSGKTTLMRMLVGLLQPSAGTARIGGHPIGTLEARAAVSYLADQPVFYDDLTVWEHLEYVARLHGTDDWEQQAVDLVDMIGLGARVDDLPATFSRGLKQKAAIALAFVRPFDVMLIDEPFVGLDRTGRLALLELLSLAHDDGATLVVATHELSSVDASSRLLALSGGEVVYDGAPADADVATLSEGVRQRDE